LSGLHYLQSIPDFENSEEVEQLIALLSNEQKTIQSIDVEPGQFDSDLAVLKRAILNNRRIQCRYVNGKGVESIRQIDPLILVSSEDDWYLRGFCLNHNEVRTFRLDHMVDAELLETARGSESLAAAAKLDDSAPIYTAATGDTEVVIELAPEAYALAGYFTQLVEPKKSGSENVLVTLKVGYLPDLGPMVCRFGGHAKVVSPAEAREVVRRYAEAALNPDLWTKTVE
jgi:proteasome accessory factor C